MLASPHSQANDLNAAYNRGMAELRNRDYVAALPYFEQALRLAREQFGENDPRIAVELNNLGEVNRLLGNLDAAERYLIEAVELDDANQPANVGAMATSLNNLALIAREKQDYTSALELYQQSRMLLEDAYGLNHPDVAKNLNNMAMLYVDRGEPEKAEPLARRALNIARTELGTQHPTTQALQANLDAIMGTGPDPNQPLIPAFKAQQQTVAQQPASAPSGTQDQATADTTSIDTGPIDSTPPARLVDPPQPRPVTAAAEEPQPAPVQAVLKPAAEAAAAAETIAAAKSGQEPAALPKAEGFAIHLASVRSAASALSEWARFRSVYPQLGQLRQNQPEKVSIDGQGDFFRVTAGDFGDRSAAQKFCELFKEAGQYCGVVRNK